MKLKLKALMEKRAELLEKSNALLDKATTENRALTEAEVTEFDGYELEINSIDETIKRAENAQKSQHTQHDDGDDDTEEQRDTKAFAAFIRSSAMGTSERTETNLTKGNNGAIIPKTIINKIIDKVKDISPIYQLATHYNIAGTINIPVADKSADSITVAYATEFSELESHSNKFTTIELTGYLYGALTKISKSLLNNSDFKLTNWVIDKMAKSIADFIENECINGTSGKTAGIAGSYDATNMTVTLATKNAITAESLIDLQELVPDKFQSNCIWIMNRATRKAIRKLKDGQGNFLLEKDPTGKWGRKLLNNDVYVTDNVPALGEDGKIVVLYGDFSGLAVKESETAEITVLLEKFATQHAIGVVAWGEIDAKVEDVQKIAVIKTPTPSLGT